MPSGSKTQTVGYRYALGAHLALCHGPVDAIREIRVDDRVAWSAATGSTPGGGAEAQTSLGTVAGMSAVAASGGADVATVSFPGALAGVRLDRSYALELLTEGATRFVTVRAVRVAAGVTTWEVEPATTAFAAQSVAVSEAAAGAQSGAGATGGRIRIDKPSLFGGESREGGIVGDVDVLMGAPNQSPNDYLEEQAGGDVPAYRGLCSLVLRQVELGLNPYLKPWAVRLTRILKAEDGAEQWRPDVAQIFPQARIGDAAIYIAMDASGSMSGARMAAQIAAVATLIDEIGVHASAPNDLLLLAYNNGVLGSIQRRNADAGHYAALKAWVEGLSTSTDGGTNYGAAVSEAETFFAGSGLKRRILVFVTDGSPSPASTLETAKASLAGLAAVDVFAFNIALADTSATEQLDNTPIDGVPVVPPGDPDVLAASLRAAFGDGPDMNPAHIIRECLTNRDWGLGHAGADIGPSFEEAADQLFAEGFGLSLIWQRDSTLEDFLGEVLTHIDASLYVDRRSGRWELRLIRAEEDPESLPVFDETNVVDWGELGRRETADLVNSVTVRFTDARTDRTGSVTVSDTALVQAMGQMVSATVDYPGIRFESLAVRVAERDLRALSASILTGEITVNRAGAGLAPGDVIRLVSPTRGLEGVAVRVVEIDHGDGRANGLRLRIAEDVFAIGAAPLIGGETPEPEPLVKPPTPLDRRWVAEAPYWLMVQELGHAQADALLAEDPDAGALVAAGERPSRDAISMQVWTDAGQGYALEGRAEFCPSALLDADVSDDPAERELPVTGWSRRRDVAVGTLASLGDELVRVDGLSRTSLTVGRGCLDTVPRAHPADTPILFWQDLAGLSEPRFAASEEVAAKMLPETGFGPLPLAQAPEDRVTLASRAVRPLPPGDLRADGAHVSTPAAKEMVLSWAHRDRLGQTSGVFDDYLAPNIGPEPGVAYQVRLHWVNGATDETIEPAAAVVDAGQATSFALVDADYPVPPPGVETAAIRVRAVRDGYDDFSFREFRVAVGGKVHVVDQELRLDLRGPSVDVLRQDLAMLFEGPGVDVSAQEIALVGPGASVDVPAQDLVAHCAPPSLGMVAQELVVEIV